MKEKEFINKWKNTDYSSYNEMDIREEFISPLLSLLGYKKDTINSILREKSLKLSNPFHRIGRKRVSIDYIPTLRLKTFWIIEAKPGQVLEMNYGDLLQVHLYAIHPEIQAQYIVLINGWEIRVYESNRTEDWDNYILCCNKSNCEEQFVRLKNLLSKQSMLDALREKINHDLKITFEAQIDSVSLEKTKNIFMNTIQEASAKVEANLRNIEHIKFQKAYEQEKREIRESSSEMLLARMQNENNRRISDMKEYVHRFFCADIIEQKSMINNVISTYYDFSSSIYKVKTIYFLTKLASQQNEYQSSIICDLEKCLFRNMTYFCDDKLQNQWSILYNLICRVAYKRALSGIPNYEVYIDEYKRTHTLEQQKSIFLDTPNWVGYETQDQISKICNQIKMGAISTTRLTLFKETLLQLEYILDKQTQPTYGKGDFLWYDFYGISYDMQIMGTWDCAHSNCDIYREIGLNDSVIKLIDITREQAIERVKQICTIFPLSIKNTSLSTNENNY